MLVRKVQGWGGIVHENGRKKGQILKVPLQLCAVVREHLPLTWRWMKKVVAVYRVCWPLGKASTCVAMDAAGCSWYCSVIPVRLLACVLTVRWIHGLMPLNNPPVWLPLFWLFSFQDMLTHRKRMHSSYPLEYIARFASCFLL